MDYNSDLDCFTHTEDSDYYYVKDNEIYYYKYIDDSKKDDGAIDMQLVKLSIKNNIVSETELGTIKKGYSGQCG